MARDVLIPIREGARRPPSDVANAFIDATSGLLSARLGDGTTVTLGGGGGSGAPTTADYLVKTANAGLSAERVVTDTTTVTWDWSVAGQAKAGLATNGVGDSYLRQGAATSVIGRSAGSTGNVADIAASADGQVLTRSSGALVWAAPADTSTLLTSSTTIAANACRFVAPNLTISTGDLTLSGDLVIGG